MASKISAESTTPVPVPNQRKVLANTLQPFVTGGMAAVFASCCIHPIDLAKVRLQLYRTMSSTSNANKLPSPAAVIMNMVKNEGFQSIYAGLSASVMRQAIYGTARIGLHRTFSNKLQKWNGDGQALPFYLKALSGMASGSIAVTIGTPFDVALVRMQADSMKPLESRRNYTNVFNALVRVSREEGVRKLYAGLAPNILRGMAMNVGMMACYDQAKEVICAALHDPSPESPMLVTKLLSSATAGFTAAAFSLPFDMLKSRLQDMRPNRRGVLPYKGLLDCALKIGRKEGPLAFWTGFTAYYGRCAPHAMIILMTIEQIKQVYRSVLALDA